MSICPKWIAWVKHVFDHSLIAKKETADTYIAIILCMITVIYIRRTLNKLHKIKRHAYHWLITNNSCSAIIAGHHPNATDPKLFLFIYIFIMAWAQILLKTWSVAATISVLIKNQNTIGVLLLWGTEYRQNDRESERGKKFVSRRRPYTDTCHCHSGYC